MDKCVATGKTVEEAIEKALSEMGVVREEVDVRIIEAPSNGFFGLWEKLAKIEISRIQPEENFLAGLSVSLSEEAEEAVSEKMEEKPKTAAISQPEEAKREFVPRQAEITDEAVLVAVRFVEEVAYLMDAGVQIASEKREEEIFISITGDKNGILIGKHGKTLDALQYLTGLAVHKVVEGRIRVVVDVEGYRERRKATLEKLAARYADQAVERGSKVVLEPMNPQERRLIHMALQEDSRIITESEGAEPYRKVVIIPKNLTSDFVIYVENFQRRGNDRRDNRGFNNRRRY